MKKVFLIVIIDEVSIGTGNGLVPDGSKPLPWTSDDQDLCHNELNLLNIKMG